MNKQSVTDISPYLVNTIATSTLEKIEKDLIAFKTKFLTSYQEVDFNQLFKDPTAITNYPLELQEEFNNLNAIRSSSREHFLLIKNNLALLIVRANIAFETVEDVLTAFFMCLPDYFQTESFLKSIKNSDNEIILDDNLIRAILSPSYVKQSEFVQRQKVNQQTQESLMFFVGSQLLDDIF